MTCEATLPRVKDPGWECTGEGLTVWMHAMGRPVVAPTTWTARVLAQPWAEAFDEPVPFTGGDHLHMCVETVL